MRQMENRENKLFLNNDKGYGLNVKNCYFFTNQINFF